MEIKCTCTVTLWKQEITWFFGIQRNMSIRKKKKMENDENILFKAVANRFRLTSKLISCLKEQQNGLWTTFYYLDFIKR